MNRLEISQYHKDLASLLNSEPNSAERRASLAEERKTPEYQAAKKEAMNRIEQVENVLAPIFNDLVLKEKVAGRARSIVEEYNGLPKRTVGQIKETKKLIRQVAEELLQNPQDIGIACLVWERHDSLYALVKEESKTLIRERWETITPGQLAELVRTYSDNPQAQDFAKEMLTSYFNRPNSRRQRIHANYTFVSSVVDLVGEDKAFNEGIRIGLQDTDILPKDPYLIEQGIFRSLPYTIFRNSSNGTKDLLSLPRDKDEVRDLQKLLTAEYVILKLSTMGSKDLVEVLRKRNDFLSVKNPVSTKLKTMWEQAQGQAEQRIGSIRRIQLHDAMNTFADSMETLPIAASKEHGWVYDLCHDQTEPLNQKSQEVFFSNDCIEND